MMRRVLDVLEHPVVYRAWMAPFASSKLRPLHAHASPGRARRVLDVGCGPGTNALLFPGADYVGVDINQAYVRNAARRFKGRFIAADVTAANPFPEERFDFILVNSLLHHIDTPSVERLLQRLAALLSADGRIHILDLVMPADPSVARFLARHDRGHHARATDEWRRLFEAAFAPLVFERYGVGLPGITLWNMVYFGGRKK